jgi:hypothetical protein
MAKLIPIQITVRGTVPFPLDMLRYDGCFPLSEGDSKLIENSIYYEDLNISRTIILLRPHGYKHWTPSYAKWKSYRWEVIETRERKDL